MEEFRETYDFDFGKRICQSNESSITDVWTEMASSDVLLRSKLDIDIY